MSPQRWFWTGVATVVASNLMLAACGGKAKGAAKTIAEQISGYTYIPTDGLPVKTTPGVGCDLNKPEYQPLLISLPDNTVRTAVEQFSSSGQVTYGPVGTATTQGDFYRVTFDHIVADNVPINLWFRRRAKPAPKPGGGTAIFETVNLIGPLDDKFTKASVVYEVVGDKPSNSEEFTRYSIPVYVGIGLRVTAQVRVLTAKASISGLGVIGAEADANHLSGTIAIQTIGVNGLPITTGLPIPSELNRTSITQALVSIGSTKALLSKVGDSVGVLPRVVGFYLPFPGDQQLVNAVFSALSQKTIEWPQRCAEPRK